MRAQRLLPAFWKVGNGRCALVSSDACANQTMRAQALVARESVMESYKDSANSRRARVDGLQIKSPLSLFAPNRSATLQARTS